MGIRDKPIAPASPWQNGFAERLIGSIRRECVDHLIVLGESLLRRQPKGDLFAPLPFLVGDAAFRLEQWSRAITNLVQNAIDASHDGTAIDVTAFELPRGQNAVEASL
jgi:signal transduction histidine kinase